MGESAHSGQYTRMNLDQIWPFIVRPTLNGVGFATLEDLANTTLEDLADVIISVPANGQTIVYNDGNWINETLPGTGTIMGTIAANQVAHGTGVDTIGGSDSFTWDNALNELIINGSTSIGHSGVPAVSLDMRGYFYQEGTTNGVGSGTDNFSNTIFNISPSVASDRDYRAIHFEATTAGATANLTGKVNGIAGTVIAGSNITIDEVNGIAPILSVTQGIVTEIAGLKTSQNYSGGEVGTSYGIYVPALTGGVTPSVASYGLKVDAPGIGFVQWTAAIGTGHSYVEGFLRIGSTASPPQALSVTGNALVSGFIQTNTSLLIEDPGVGTNVVAIVSPTLPSSYTLTLPTSSSAGALTNDGAGHLSWVPDAGGDVVGPGSATDNAITRFDLTTGKLIQNSSITLDDNGYLNFAGNAAVTAANTQIGASNGNMIMNVPTSKSYTIGINSTDARILFGTTQFAISHGTVTSGNISGFAYTKGIYSGLTASTEQASAQFNFQNNAQWATGNFATQREMRIMNPSYSAVGASVIDDCTTLTVEGAPNESTNMTLTRSSAVWFQWLAGRLANSHGTTSDIRLSGIPFANGITGTVAGLYEIWGDNSTVNLGNITATTTNINRVRLEALTFTSTTNTRTVTNAVTLYAEAPIAGTNVTFTNPALAAKFVGDVQVTGSITSNGVSVPTILAGTDTLAAGTKTITAAITANSRIVVTLKDANPGAGGLTVGLEVPVAARNVGAGTFVVQANVAAGTINVLDTSTFDWVIIG